MTAPLYALADALHGIVDPTTDRILTPAGHLVWCGLTGDVKLARTGHPDTTLGKFRDVTGCAAEYTRITGAGIR